MARELLTVPIDVLRRRTSAKWRRYDPDVLPLWVAEMDVQPAPTVADALAGLAATGDYGYPFGRRYEEAVTRWYSDHGTLVEGLRSALVADVMTGVAHSLRSATSADGAVVITTPVYPPFHSVVREVGRRLVEAPLDVRGRLDLEALEAAFVEAGPGSALLLANPHNPTGVAHTAEELRAVLALAHEHGLRVVSDEIHAPLVLAGAAFTSVLGVEGGEGAVVVTSAAKGWNLAGLKAAVVLAGSQARDVLAGFPPSAPYGPSHVGVVAHTAALDGGQDWIRALLRDLDANRVLLGQLLAEHLPAVTWQPMEATYLAWLDCSALELGREAGRHFLDEARVALMEGTPFGAGFGDHVRLNIATSPEIITEAVERMSASL